LNTKPKGLFILNKDAWQKVYTPFSAQLGELIEIGAPPQTAAAIRQNLHLLDGVEILLTGWGCPRLDEDFLRAAPSLKIVLYGAGSIKQIVTEAFWAKNIPITTAASANAIPVAEYTLSQIIFCLKGGWYYALTTRNEGRYPPRKDFAGGYGSTVGIVSLGLIGRLVCERLRAFDIRVLAYDLFISPETARLMGVELCSLEELFQRSDVVSLHTPWLTETTGLIKGNHFTSMKPNAAFLNTARGAVVNEPEMIAALRERPDIYAVLDVTYPEPPPASSPLYKLPNVVLTPHIAGSEGHECGRMGEAMLEELKRHLNAEPLRWAVSREQIAFIA